MSLAESLIAAIFPQACVACHTALNGRPRCGLCAPCYEVLTPNDGRRCLRCDVLSNTDACPDCHDEPPQFSALRAPFQYGGPLADVVTAAKFHGREDLASALGKLVSEDAAARALASGASALVPVPLGLQRRRQRGYNQSTLMARSLSRTWGVPVVHALTRVRDTAPQSALPKNERTANLRGAFRATRAIVGRIVLVDDVVTSTATVRQAAAALRAGGATDVAVVTACRSALD